MESLDLLKELYRKCKNDTNLVYIISVIRSDLERLESIDTCFKNNEPLTEYSFDSYSLGDLYQVINTLMAENRILAVRLNRLIKHEVEEE